ncbi:MULTISPECIES: hypothetical protein [unclassified Crossiella]|uniref:hypothetical protein n=1 Tax=unclassified Crossiella TaxID=2620835 RepID=UPI001FFE5B5F|nr:MULTISPECIES: hypothetical protein [unclassified Crossiella]MCK2243751.1 hypothetical protein [Crossiella sp. S99.2]MCK2257610.1 hypothetical protein [Crossiella sp. S99.1]
MPNWTAFQRSCYPVLPAPMAWAITREFASLAAVLRLLPDCLVPWSGHDVVAVVPLRGNMITGNERQGAHPELDLAEGRLVLPNGRGTTSLVIRPAAPVRARLGRRIGPARVIPLGVDDPRAFRRAAAESGKDAGQVQAQAPEESGVTGAVTVASPSCQF